jgi:hypothetical protein
MEYNIKTYITEDQKDFGIQKIDNIVFKRLEHNNLVNIKIRVSGGSNFQKYESAKESLYLTAIGNLRKQTHFLKLHIELLSEQISDEEYENELEQNSIRYFVDIRPIESNLELYSLMGV